MLVFLRFLIRIFFIFLGLIFLGLATIYIGHKYIFPISYRETSQIPDIKKDGFCFGVNCQESPETAEEFISLFANQIKAYDKNASSIWPNNQVVDLHIIVQSIESNKSWLISPQGDFKSLTKKELKELSHIRNKYSVGFNPFESDDIRGVYLALSEKEIKNVLEYEKYQYLGTYDLFLTFSHEMFHHEEQDKNWASPDTISNRSRNPRLKDIKARTNRNFLFNQILKANAAKTSSEKDSLILQVLSNYEYYKTNYPEDFEATKYFDRIEGTAHYFEIIASLYSAYPKQIDSEESLKKALRVLAENDSVKPYDDPGTDSESYGIGAWTGFLLDDVQQDSRDWKKEIMENPNVTPLDILAEQYLGKTLPEPIIPSSDLEEKVKLAIEEKENQKVAPKIFRMLYQLIFN